MTIAIIWFLVNGLFAAWFAYDIAFKNSNKFWKTLWWIGLLVNLIATYGNIMRIAEILQQY